MAEFFMNFAMFSLPIRIITCLCKGLLIAMLIWGLAFGAPLTMLLIWSIFFAPIEEKISLILITSDMLVVCLETWA